MFIQFNPAIFIQFNPAKFIQFNPAIYIQFNPAIYIQFSSAIYIQFNPAIYIQFNPAMYIQSCNIHLFRSEVDVSVGSTSAEAKFHRKSKYYKAIYGNLLSYDGNTDYVWIPATDPAIFHSNLNILYHIFIKTH